MRPCLRPRRFALGHRAHTLGKKEITAFALRLERAHQLCAGNECSTTRECQSHSSAQLQPVAPKLTPSPTAWFGQLPIPQPAAKNRKTSTAALCQGAVTPCLRCSEALHACVNEHLKTIPVRGIQAVHHLFRPAAMHGSCWQIRPSYMRNAAAPRKQPAQVHLRKRHERASMRSEGLRRGHGGLGARRGQAGLGAGGRARLFNTWARRTPGRSSRQEHRGVGARLRRELGADCRLGRGLGRQGRRDCGLGRGLGRQSRRDCGLGGGLGGRRPGRELGAHSGLGARRRLHGGLGSCRPTARGTFSKCGLG